MIIPRAKQEPLGREASHEESSGELDIFEYEDAEWNVAHWQNYRSAEQAINEMLVEIKNGADKKTFTKHGLNLKDYYEYQDRCLSEAMGRGDPKKSNRLAHLAFAEYLEFLTPKMLIYSKQTPPARYATHAHLQAIYYYAQIFQGIFCPIALMNTAMLLLSIYGENRKLPQLPKNSGYHNWYAEILFGNYVPYIFNTAIGVVYFNEIARSRIEKPNPYATIEIPFAGKIEKTLIMAKDY